LATLDGERHALELSLAQLCLRSAGLEVLWVGVDTPLDALVAYIRDAEPRLIGLSASKFSTDDHGVLGKSYRTIAAVCRARGIAVILGGTGAWPEVIDYGYRCVSFADLRRVLATLDLQKEITN
jgi:cobalamin-dependent methionine synthase I